METYTDHRSGGGNAFHEAEGLATGQAIDRGLDERLAESADDLHAVTATLAHRIDDLKQLEIALAGARAVLAETEFALTSAHADERRATQRALYDSATGLTKRVLFDDRLAHAISLAERHHWTLAVMFLDLDGFRNLNDEFGHSAGDRVLQEIASHLSRVARDEDTVCRNGGDEFLFLVLNPQSRSEVERTAAVVLESVARPIEFEGCVLDIHASIGIALYPEDGTKGEQLIRNADSAMFRAKQRGGGCVLFGSDREPAAP